ncbi:putative colanic acid biosynthesis acetyltransferase WcaF [[Leptolyngbya] sp. PCC 7376]|nr:putative colanic acid biosynthesis acetyltransferase WcaF [[Leptolyngbya] sp. PCC 7376]
MRLDLYTVGSYSPGASLLKRLLWYFFGAVLVRSYLIPFSGLKVVLLRLFGATIGQGVRIKPGVRVKFPWRLVIGDFVWIGEDAWLDNLAPITIGDHVCISQGVYLCTGNHDWSAPEFSLKTQAIAIESDSWLAAGARVAPGVTIGKGAILALGAIALKPLEPMMIYQGNPAIAVRQRQIRELSPSEISISTTE